MINKHGLSRDIPEPIKRQVRTASGFDCVVCGASLVQYEHVDPPFAEAKEHRSDQITLLCHSCHGHVTRGYWSKDRVKLAMADPYCRREGFSWGNFDFGDRHPSVRFGGVLLSNCDMPVVVRGQPLFLIQGPECPGAPFRLSAFFSDASANPLLTVHENEWRVAAGVWDVEFTAGRILIRDGPGTYSLVLVAEPPNGIRIDRLRMHHGGLLFDADPDTLRIGDGVNWSTMTGCVADNCRVGLMLG